MPRVEQYSTEQRQVAGAEVVVTSYRIDDRYHCTVASVDPGATISRADGATRDEAQRRALAEAEALLTGARSA